MTWNYGTCIKIPYPIARSCLKPNAWASMLDVKVSIIKTFQVGLCGHSQFNRYSEVFFWMIVGGSLNGPSLICFRLHLLMRFEYPKFIHLHPATFFGCKIYKVRPPLTKVSNMTDDLLKSPPVPCGHGPLALWTSHGLWYHWYVVLHINALLWEQLEREESAENHRVRVREGLQERPHAASQALYELQLRLKRKSKMSKGARRNYDNYVLDGN